MKVNDTVWIPQGWDGTKERPMTTATVLGFKTHMYSNRPDGKPDVVIVRDSTGTYLLSIDSVKEKGYE